MPREPGDRQVVWAVVGTALLAIALVGALCQPEVAAAAKDSRTFGSSREGGADDGSQQVLRLYLPWLGQSPRGLLAHLPDRMVVRYVTGTSSAERTALRLLLGAEVVESIPAVSAEVLAVRNAEKWIGLADRQPQVAYAELDYLIAVSKGEEGGSPRRFPLSEASVPFGSPALAWHADRSVSTPDDPLYPEQWHHAAVHSDAAWRLASAAGVTVAIIDTGVDCTHPDLTGACIAGYDFVNDDREAADDQGHGTHVAGIAAATGLNGVGGIGVGWGAWLMPLKVIDETGVGSYTDMARALVWATDHGADVINLSIGGPADTKTIQDAVSYARSHGVVVVAAAGNAGSSNRQFPAAHEGVIAVAATNRRDERASFSNHGAYIDLSAPGVRVLSTFEGGYAEMSGTSMAAPVVSGVAALLRGGEADASPKAIEELLAATARDLSQPGWDPLTGYGLVDAERAMRVLTAPTPTQTAVPTRTASAPAPTPVATTIRPGETVRGTAETDAPLPLYCFEGADWISMRLIGSLGFDPQLRLYALGAEEPIAENDNGEGIGANSFLTIRLVPGWYCVQPGGRGEGAFALRMEEGRSAGVGDVDKSCAVDLADQERIDDAIGGRLEEDCDLNLDGHVTAADLIIWHGNYARDLRCP